MKALLNCLIVSLLFAATAAFADANVPFNPSHSGSGVHSASKKASSFAPDHRTKRRVYGTPIQLPILKARPKRTPPTQGASRSGAVAR